LRFINSSNERYFKKKGNFLLKIGFFLLQYSAYFANRRATSPETISSSSLYPISETTSKHSLPSKLHSDNSKILSNRDPPSDISQSTALNAIPLPRDDSTAILAPLVQPADSPVDEDFRVAYNELEVGNFSLLDYANNPETNCILLVECLAKTNPTELQFSGRLYSPNNPTKLWNDFIKPASKNYFLSWKATKTVDNFYQHNITHSNFVIERKSNKKTLDTQGKPGGKQSQSWQHTVLIPQRYFMSMTTSRNQRREQDEEYRREYGAIPILKKGLTPRAYHLGPSEGPSEGSNKEAPPLS